LVKRSAKTPAQAAAVPGFLKPRSATNYNGIYAQSERAGDNTTRRLNVKTETGRARGSSLLSKALYLNSICRSDREDFSCREELLGYLLNRTDKKRPATALLVRNVALTPVEKLK
jgi:hypothetical protein